MMFWQSINANKNLYCIEQLPLVTVYDDNLFIRNDYDVLSPGQRNYLITFFTKHGFKQKSGTLLANGAMNIHFPKPQSNLAVSAFEARFIDVPKTDFYCVTPTQFAESLFYFFVDKEGSGEELVDELKCLINKCPFNIEWLRDISYHSPIESLTLRAFNELSDYQSAIIEEKFKKKRAL